MTWRILYLGPDGQKRNCLVEARDRRSAPAAFFALPQTANCQIQRVVLVP